MLPPGGCNINLYSVVYDAMLHLYNIGFVRQGASSFTCSVNLVLSHTQYVDTCPFSCLTRRRPSTLCLTWFLLLLSVTGVAGELFSFLY